MKDFYGIFYDASGAMYVLFSLVLRAMYDWERTTMGQKMRQFSIGLLLAVLVNKVFLDVYGHNDTMMRYIGAVTFACAFLGEIGLDTILKKIIFRINNK